MTRISAVIITMNEESLIENCLRSVDGIADEIIVVDSFSTDSTEAICQKYNVRFFQHEFTGFMDQKNYAVSLASNRYILSLDADEVLSSELRESLTEEKKELRYDGYLFNRHNNYCGKWINHSGWYPDRQLRLFNSDKGKWGVMNVHERFRLNRGSRIKKVKGDILHYTSNSRTELTEKIERYSQIAADEMFRMGVRVWYFTPLVHMAWRFIHTYFVQLGFLDGISGYRICSESAYSSYLKYSKLRKLYKGEEERD
jgi:glycosyltransferase involved in cell wall biosynthesis